VPFPYMIGVQPSNILYRLLDDAPPGSGMILASPIGVTDVSNPGPINLKR
jgi:hypothetical protein